MIPVRFLYLSPPRLGPRDVQRHLCKEIKERTGYLFFVLQTSSQLFATVLSTQEVELTDCVSEALHVLSASGRGNGEPHRT